MADPRDIIEVDNGRETIKITLDDESGKSLISPWVNYTIPYLRDEASLRIYNWIIKDNIINLYRYCKIVKLIYDLGKTYLNEFLEKYDVPKIYRRVQTINDYMANYYKNKTYDKTSDNYLIDISYRNHLFNNMYFYNNCLDLNNTLTKEKAEYILTSNQFKLSCKKYSNFPKIIKFIYKCKQLEVDKFMIRIYSGIDGEIINEKYLEYADFNYENYLEYLNFRKDSLSCMEFINTLGKSLEDLNTDEIVLSRKTITEIIEHTNIKQYLDHF